MQGAYKKNETLIPRQKLVSHGDLFAIKQFLKAEVAGELFVTDRSGTMRCRLSLNNHGNICYRDGNVLRVLDRNSGDFYLEGESVLLLDCYEKKLVDSLERLKSAPGYKIVGARSEVERKVENVISDPEVPNLELEPVYPVGRLKDVMDIISVLDSRYLIYARVSTKGVTIRCKNPGNAADSVRKLQNLGCTVKASNTYLDVGIVYSREEEKEAKAAGHKMVVIY